ncbi:Nucleolar protein 9 [Xylographa opegraphella]|nr:Nucleolar protein 9 [Xylographa opegraphella]
MPKENKKRGRREEKKRKRDEYEINQEESPKRQRSEEKVGDNVEIILDVDPSSNYQESAPAPLPEDTPFYGLLDEEEQTYFKRADSLLELNQFADDEERNLFLANVYREAGGKELKVVCSQSCSRLVERLIRLSTAEQLKSLFQKLTGHFLHLVQHRFASHCCEALFIQAAPIVTQELIAPIAESKELVDDGRISISMEDLFLSVVKELEGNLGYLMTDNFASHTLRLLLIVLSGQPLRSTATTSLLRSKKKEKIDITGRRSESKDEDMAYRTVPGSFQVALDEMILGTVAGLDTTYLRALATHPTGNPVLQLLVELEFSRSGKSKAREENSLFKRLLPDDPPVEGTQSASFVKGLLYDPVGSRLLETIVQYAPGKVFKTLYKSLFRDSIGNLARNDIAGFVVGRILERLSHDDLQYAVGQICQQAPSLLERQRTSVIKTMIERCRVREVDMQVIADTITTAYGGYGPSMLVNMVHLSKDDTQAMDPERKLQLEVQDSGKLHGSLLAQTMVAATGPLRDLICQSIIAMDTSTLLLMAKDRTATHVLQAALTCEGQTTAFRRKIIQQFYGHMPELALDTVASHVVDAFWTGTEDLLFVRERIAEVLLQNEAALRESYSGRAVWRNWMMDLYKRRRVDWILKAKGSQDAEGAFANPKPRDGTTAKSGIELARARFAATKAGKATRGRPRIGTGANGVLPSGRSGGLSAKV